MCHTRMNALGFAMSPLDSRGFVRSQEERLSHEGQPLTFPIDATVNILIGEQTKSVNGAAELSNALSSTRSLELCFVRAATSVFKGALTSRGALCTAERVINGARAQAATLQFNTLLPQIVAEQIQKEMNP